jgi:alkaline phosphatase
MHNLAQPNPRLLSRPALSLVGLLLIGCTPPDSSIPQATAVTVPEALLNTTANQWYTESAAAVAETNRQVQRLFLEAGSAKNIILFVGDGMGVTTVTAARIFDGQQQGMSGEENSLSFGKFPFVGLSKTYNVDAQTADSAGTMTALISGVKTNIGVIGLDEDTQKGDCASAAGNQLFTALELAEIAGMSTGIVSTARITHATPAATYAKSADRDWENPSMMPAAAIAAGCEDIASQLVNFERNLEARYPGIDVDGIEVALGGGRREFLPHDPAANSRDARSSIEGDRNDNRNLVDEWQGLYPKGDYVIDQAGFDAVDADSSENLFGLFNESEMRYEADRVNDLAGEPSLTEMTTKAIDILDNNEQGFFLMVEAGRIDHGHHANSAFAALSDTVELSLAVQAALDATSRDDTLIIVTADHSHVFTMAGYPKRGNPILGKVVDVGSDEPALDDDGLPYTTLGYANGLGFRDLGDETNADMAYYSKSVSGRQDLTAIDTETQGFHQEVLVPLEGETHGGEDVAIYGIGPGAHLVTGTNEQSIVFHVMNYAGNLFEKAAAELR